MNREKQLVKNTAIITIGKIGTQFVSFFLLPLYTKLLSTEEYGIVDLLNTYITLLVPIVTLQIEQSLFRYLIDYREDENGKKKIITTVILSVIVQCLIYLGIYIIIGRFIQNEYKYFLATNVVACIFSSIMLQISRGLGDNLTYTKGTFISAISIILFNILFIVGFNMGAYGMIISSLISNLLSATYIFIKKKVIKYIDIKTLNLKKLKEMYKYSVPLIPNAISWWVVNASDRTIITTVLGTSANGIYSAANKFSNLFIVFYNIFNITWTEAAAVHINDQDKEEFFSKIINTSFRIFSCIGLLIIAIMPFLFNILINEKFGEAYYQIPILMLSTLFNIVVGLFSVVYVAKKLTKEIAKTSIISAMINIISNMLLIRYIGLYAASISTVIAYFVMAITRYFDIKKYIKIKISKKLILSITIIMILLFITYYYNNIYMNFIMLFVTMIYSIIVNRDLIKIIKPVLQKVKIKFQKGER